MVVMVSPGTAVGTAITNTATVTSATSSLNIANTSQTVTTNVLAPVVPEPPAVVDLKRFGSNSQPTILVLWFSLPLNSAAAQNVANYRIVMLGGSGGGGSRGGKVIRVTKAVYNAAAQTVTLHWPIGCYFRTATRSRPRVPRRAVSWVPMVPVSIGAGQGHTGL